MTSLSHAGPGGGGPVELLFDAEYGYDAVGNRTFTRRLPQAERSERYGYDNLNRLTIMERGLLNEDGTAVVTPISHPTLAGNQPLTRRIRRRRTMAGRPVSPCETRRVKGADLDRRGNWPLTRRNRLSFAAAPRHRGLAALRVKGWLDYRWARTVDGESSNYRQTRDVTPTNEYWAVRLPDLDPALVALMQYDAAGNLTLDRLGVNAGDPCGPGVPACGSGQPCGVGILSGVDPGSAGLSACPTGQEYVYDVENRLTEVKRHTDGATLARYEYDALGRRIHTIEYVDAATGATLSPPKKTRHVYVGLETIEEYECTVQPPCEAEDWHLAREFLWALDAWTTALRSSASNEAGPAGLMRQGWGDTSRFPEPLAMITHGGASGGQGGTGVPAGESAYHYLHDVLGSVIGLTDKSGTLVERYTYDPYGRTFIETADGEGVWTPAEASAFGNPWLWTGQRYDAATGLYAFLFRTYSPALGRWLQRDSAGFADGVNLYQYLMGSPLDMQDPLGLWSKEVHDKIIDCLAKKYGWPSWYVKLLKEASEALDDPSKWSDPEEAKKHSQAKPGQDPDEARKERDEWIEDQMEEIDRLLSEYLETGDKSKLEEAVRLHGEIIHALSDETAPGHGFAEWNPPAGVLEQLLYAARHGAGEGIGQFGGHLEETLENIRKWKRLPTNPE